MPAGSRRILALPEPWTRRPTPSPNFYAPRPLVNAEVLRLDHPGVYGYTGKMMPIEYTDQPLLDVAEAGPAGSVLARAVGGDARGAERPHARAQTKSAIRLFAVDVPGGFSGKGRVVLFSNNPIYRWQNHGEFNMVFDALLNWNDLGRGGRGGDANHSSLIPASRIPDSESRSQARVPSPSPIPAPIDDQN